MTDIEEAKIVKKLGAGVVGKVAANKKPLYVDNISNDARFQNHKTLKSYKTNSFICTPLLTTHWHFILQLYNFSEKAWQNLGNYALKSINIVVN